jgi:hypothetical protein
MSGDGSVTGLVWRTVEETVALTNPDAPPPVRCVAVAFAESWLDEPSPGPKPLGLLAVGVDAPPMLVEALRGEPYPPSKIATQWSADAHGPGGGGLVCCRVTVVGGRVHRFDLMIPATDSLVAMFARAGSLVVASDEDMAAVPEAGLLKHPLLFVPNQPEFWQELMELDLGEPLNFE